MPSKWPNPSPGLYKIYSLSDPRDGRVRYVGATINTRKRLFGHLTYTTRRYGNHAVHKWMASLLDADLLPVLEILEIITAGESWQDAEKKHIAHFRELVPDLLNKSDGGAGATGVFPSAETRARMSARHKGVAKSPERRALIGDALKKYYAVCPSPCKGRVLTPEHRAKIGNAIKGKVRSAEFRAKVSAAKKGKPVSAEHLAKLWEGGRKWRNAKESL